MKHLILFLILTVVNLSDCLDWEINLLEKIDSVLEKQQTVLNQLKGYEEHLQRIPELHYELEHVKDIVKINQDSLNRLSQEVGECLKTLDSFQRTSKADECLEGSHACGHEAVCTEKLIKYTCSCPGFEWNGQDCVDTDECAQGRADCSSPHASCVNSIGSYSCSCNPPFEEDGRTACSCPQGFASDGKNCEDIDECAMDTAHCSPHARCLNLIGSFSCSCIPPFEGDGRTCDIDECAQGESVCSSRATCKNSIGSYSCVCNPPFEGDGHTCEFNCKSPAKVTSGLGCIRYVEELKTWKRMRDICQTLGGRLLQGFRKEDLSDIEYEGWIGVYNERWIGEGSSRTPADLWREGFRAKSSKRCGYLRWESSSSAFEVAQDYCSKEDWGICQFVS